MSRTKAKKELSLETFEQQMKGIHTTSVCRATLDEAPDAYKPMAEIIEQVHHTVRIDAVLKPIYNYKAH